MIGWARRKEAAVISLVRVFMVSILFGNFASLFYSLAGAVLSLAGMVLLKQMRCFSCIAVSVTGGVLHNVGQICMACILLETNVVRYYLPFLIISGTLAGIVVGITAAVIVKRVDIPL